MGKRSLSFGHALQAVRASLGLSQGALGVRLGVSRRTLTRWEIHDELPPIPQRKHLATSFPDVPGELAEALARAMELDEGFVASVAAARAASSGVPPMPSPGALDGALLELCESADVAPGRLRPALVGFLRRAEALGLSLPSTRMALEASPTKASRRRAAGSAPA